MLFINGRENHMRFLVIALCVVGFRFYPHGQVYAAEPEEPVYFADAGLKAAVEEELGVTDPTPSDMLSLNSLSASGRPILDLTGLEKAYNIKHLYMARCMLSDLSPLSQLTNLTRLNLNENQISDLLPLSNLINLNRLELRDNKIEDLTGLEKLTNLTDLIIRSNLITDLTPLSEMTSLINLDLLQNQISALSPLSKMTKLETLNLVLNQVSNLSGISQLMSLTYLSLSENHITDLSGLSGLSNLNTLNLQSNEITDISALSHLNDLTELNLMDNHIADLTPLSELESLTRLSLNSRKIADFSPLSEMKELEYLSISGSQISNISFLSGMIGLKDLYLVGNQISDLSSISGLNNLNFLDLGWNQITDISALLQLNQLITLYLNNNQISELSTLSDIINLNRLTLHRVSMQGNPLSCTAYCIDLPNIRREFDFLMFSHDEQPDDSNCQSNVPTPVFVDAKASVGGDGTSWNRSFKYLQDAISVAKYGDDICIAQGVYRPDQGTNIALGDHHAVFQMKPGVSLKGGYAGLGQVDPNQRDVDGLETILSGDLLGNDDENGYRDGGDASRNDNSEHIISMTYADDKTILDGLTITAAGHAKSSLNPGGGITFAHLSTGSGTTGGTYSYPTSTIINCEFSYNYSRSNGGGIYLQRPTNLINCDFLNNHSSLGGGININNGSNLNLQGCFFYNNTSDSSGGAVLAVGNTQLSDCVFSGNTAQHGDSIYADRYDEYSYGRPRETVYTFDNVVLHKISTASHKTNEAYFRFVNMKLDGELNLAHGRLGVSSVLVEGSGVLTLNDKTLFRIMPGIHSYPTTVRSAINGPGSIEIEPAAVLILEGDSVVNLSRQTHHLPDPENSGRIIVKGSLVVQGNATLESTNVDVHLLDVNTPNEIQYNNITLQEASTGYGGEFYVSENATIRYNNIVSEGDRYLDMDPDPKTQPKPTLTQNRITVIIKEGINSRQGTLLELRAKDYEGIRASGAYPVPATSDGFTEDPSENWVLEKLILEPHAKLNLTNRQGFEFQDLREPYPETVYVKELRMAPNSVLNTALQTLYYQDLVLTDHNDLEIARNPAQTEILKINGAQIVDIPLLGFSLRIIAMDDEKPSPHNEFNIRVRKRTTDPADNNSASSKSKSSEPIYEGAIERWDFDPTYQPQFHGGYMEMRTQAQGKQSARSVAAKGAFARAGDEDITVEFEYLFIDDPQGEAELYVYLSDNPEVSRSLVPIARLRPSQPGRPGSLSSRRFAVFSGVFPRGSLNFTRGTYVELELRGRNTRCWIDNWDPSVHCTAICGDYDTSDYKGINIYDYLTLLAEFGLSRPGSIGKGCLDLVGDGCVNTDDLQAWEGKGILNRCGQASSNAANTVTNSTRLTSYQNASTELDRSNLPPLLIVGKPYYGQGNEVPESHLYAVVPDGNAVDTNPPGLSTISDGRLVSDNNGNLYQVNGTYGLKRLDTAITVIAPKQIKQGNATILIGIHDYDHDGENEGFQLQDCAFDPCDASIVYVVPVLVDRGNGPYMAAAKLKITNPGNYTVLATYGTDPATDHSQSNSKLGNTGTLLLEPDMQHLHEIEIDAQGQYIYVLNRHIFNDNSRILVYAQSDGNQPVAVCDVNIAAPTAMVLSTRKDHQSDTKLYLASSIVSPNDLNPQVHCFAVGTNRRISYERSISIAYPPPYYDFGHGFKAAITALTEDPSDGTLYATGFSAPCFPEDASIYQSVQRYFPNDGPNIFPTSVLAVVTPGSTSGKAKEIEAGSTGMGLPLSILHVER